MTARRKRAGLEREDGGTAVRSHEVAALAGVHRSTVSRALSPRTAHLVNAATRQRVLAAVEQLGYRTNAIAQSLRMGRSLTVGVLIPDITNPLFPPVVRGTDDVLHEHGHSSLVGYSDGDAGRAQEYLERFGHRGVDGMIVATARLSDPPLEDLAARGVPLVLVNRRLAGEDVPYVIVDDRPGIVATVEHLSRLGHRRIACIAAPQVTSTGRDRLVHFRDAAARAGLEPVPGLLVEAAAVSRGEGQRLCADLLQRREPPTAIVAANDVMALGCLDALHLRGLRCPEDVSIVGFNDMPFAGEFSPALTTVRFDHYAMGVTAARILLGEMAVTDPVGRDRVALPSELVVRESTGPVPEAGARRRRRPAPATDRDAPAVDARLQAIERALQELTARLDQRPG